MQRKIPVYWCHSSVIEYKGKYKFWEGVVGDIGVDLFSWLGGGGERCPSRWSEATERGEGVGGNTPSNGRDFVKNLEYQNHILEHLNTIF